MLELVLDVGEPWLGAPGVTLNVLLVGEVVLGLRIESVIFFHAFSGGEFAIPPTPGLAGDRMPERGWMTSRDAMFLVSLDSDCCASVARDVESNRGKGAAGKIEVMRRVGTASLLRSRRGGVARWRERDGVGRWQLEVRVESSSWCVFLFGFRMVRPFRRLGANSKRTQVQGQLLEAIFQRVSSSVQPVLGSEWARAGNPGFAAELTFRPGCSTVPTALNTTAATAQRSSPGSSTTTGDRVPPSANISKLQRRLSITYHRFRVSDIRPSPTAIP